MEQRQHAPAARGKHAGAYRRVEHKGRDFFLSPYQYRVFSHLNGGGACSTMELSHALKISDPRSTIRDLRNSGISVGDVWCKTADGKRYKRYFIRKEVQR